MAKKKASAKRFQPFIHDNLQIKNELLEMARKARNVTSEKKLEDALASILIYSNIAEYLAEYLFQHLNYFVRESTYKDFAGILYIENVSTNNSNVTLGGYIKEIQKFNFPDKLKILECFQKICKSRNRIFHNFAKCDIETLTNLVAQDLPIIQDECEELIGRINIIFEGLQKILASPSK
jgi:uncharacterized protein with HEPN domain